MNIFFKLFFLYFVIFFSSLFFSVHLFFSSASVFLKYLSLSGSGQGSQEGSCSEVESKKREMKPKHGNVFEFEGYLCSDKLNHEKIKYLLQRIPQNDTPIDKSSTAVVDLTRNIAHPEKCSYFLDGAKIVLSGDQDVDKFVKRVIESYPSIKIAFNQDISNAYSGVPIQLIKYLQSEITQNQGYYFKESRLARFNSNDQTANFQHACALYSMDNVFYDGFVVKHSYSVSKGALKFEGYWQLSDAEASRIPKN